MATIIGRGGLQEGLKAAVWHAPAGTGEVQRIITEAPFKPGVRGFTSLLQLCSRDRSPKAWQKVGSEAADASNARMLLGPPVQSKLSTSLEALVRQAALLMSQHLAFHNRPWRCGTRCESDPTYSRTPSRTRWVQAALPGFTYGHTRFARYSVVLWRAPCS